MWFRVGFHTRFSEENQVQTYMHARIKFHAYSNIKVYTKTVSRMKKKDYQRFTLNPGNEGSKHHRQTTGGCVRLALHNIFTSSSCSFLLLSNIVYSKGEHLSYSASVGKRMNAKAL
jgi:predicted fused transcriptional regulator/phosphomethylpyrimidine kinase